MRELGSELATALLHAYPTAAGFQGVPMRRVAALRYDGRHKVGDELAADLIAAAAGSVGRHHGEVYRVQVRYTCEDLEVLRRRLQELQGGDIDRLLEQHEIGRLLTTIDGIGPQTAARLVATFGDFSSFPRKRTFQRASLTPIGAARLRAKLWMPVLTAVRTNPWLRAYYERLIARGKLPKVALVAAMRKLLHAVYSVAKKIARLRRPLDF